MRIVIIDAQAREIRESEFSYGPNVGSTLKQAQNIVGGLIEKAYTLLNGDELYVHEEALLQRPLPNDWFIFDGFNQPIAGNGFIVGSGLDDWAGAHSTVDQVKPRVRFLDLEAVRLLTEKSTIVRKAGK